ncbi:hypothetical protein HZS_2347, partial [Henneguya salminicola]
MDQIKKIIDLNIELMKEDFNNKMMTYDSIIEKNSTAVNKIDELSNEVNLANQKTTKLVSQCFYINNSILGSEISKYIPLLESMDEKVKKLEAHVECLLQYTSMLVQMGRRWSIKTPPVVVNRVVIE